MTEIEPPHGDRTVFVESGHSSVSISCDRGTLRVWSTTQVVETDEKCILQLAPGQMAIVGRQQGGQLEYLDPTFTPTRLVPGSGQSVLGGDDERDICVSRGHFTLKGSRLGICLINGVPRAGGGIRPPLNWTYLLEPDHRLMERGEEYLIEREAEARIQLPNGVRILLQAS